MNKIESLHKEFPWHPFVGKHDLASHALFDLGRIVQLAATLDESSVEYNSGKLVPGQDPSKTPANGLSIEETITDIEKNNSWMVIKNIENDDSYRELLHATLDKIFTLCDRSKIGTCDDYQGFLFVSSPNAVTPFHVDPEHNFLVQIRGTKTMHQWQPNDHSVVPVYEIEKTYNVGSYQRNLPYKKEIQTKARTFNLSPGEYLHVPYHAPHWVKVGNETSISLSVTFQSEYSQKRNKIFQLNNMLRQAGLTKRSVDELKIRDKLISLIGYRGVNLLTRMKNNPNLDDTR